MSLRLILEISFLVLIFTACKNPLIGDANTLIIKKYNQHPFLIDHSRQLVSLNYDGDTISRVNIFPETGSGCCTHVFLNDDNKIIVVDCNGCWYSIDRSDMIIRHEGWKWNQELPQKYIGRMNYDKISGCYKLDEKTPLEIQEVYRYKVPECDFE